MSLPTGVTRGLAAGSPVEAEGEHEQGLRRDRRGHVVRRFAAEQYDERRSHLGMYYAYRRVLPVEGFPS